MDANKYIQTLPSDTNVYVITESMQRIPLELFNWEAPNIHYSYPGQIDEINPDNNNFQIIMTDKNDEVAAELYKKFPALTFQEVNDDRGMSYYVMK